MKKRQLIILVLYINVDRFFDSSGVEQFMNKVRDKLTIKDDEFKNYEFMQFYIPVKDQKTRMECVYPKLKEEIFIELEKENISFIKKIIDILKIKYELLTKNNNREIN